MPDPVRRSLSVHTVAMTTGLIGWFVCAQFASVAYSWTFYYLLALIVAARELVGDRLAAGSALQAGAGSVASRNSSLRLAKGAA
jgi:branched-subunit amino acid transport protein